MLYFLLIAFAFCGLVAFGGFWLLLAFVGFWWFLLTFGGFRLAFGGLCWPLACVDWRFVALVGLGFFTVARNVVYPRYIKI